MGDTQCIELMRLSQFCSLSHVHGYYHCILLLLNPFLQISAVVVSSLMLQGNIDLKRVSYSPAGCSQSTLRSSASGRWRRPSAAAHRPLARPRPDHDRQDRGRRRGASDGPRQPAVQAWNW